MTSTSYDRTNVFISYSHEDAKYLKRLKTHLAFYERSGLLNVWEDTKLAQGSQWRTEIKEAIEKARIAILLVSADFLASKFIAEEELPPLLVAAKTEGTIIIPVILSACAFDVRRITPASRLAIGGGSWNAVLFKQFQDNETADYAIIDLGEGENWLTSRLYIFAIMLERMRGLRCFVFLETKDEVDQRFIGIASPSSVRWALAHRYPWLEGAFAQAYFSVIKGPDRQLSSFSILSPTGVLNQFLAQKIVRIFLNGLQRTPPFASPLHSEWVALSEANWPQLREHARWLDATCLRQDLGDILLQDESTWLVENSDTSYTEQARSILHRRVPFIAIVDKEMRFKYLIDRQDFLERTVTSH